MDMPMSLLSQAHIFGQGIRPGQQHLILGLGESERNPVFDRYIPVVLVNYQALMNDRPESTE
jgi:hypothetical protein